MVSSLYIWWRLMVRWYWWSVMFGCLCVLGVVGGGGGCSGGAGGWLGIGGFGPADTGFCMGVQA